MKNCDIFFSKDKEPSKIVLYKKLGVLEESIKNRLPKELQSDFDNLIKLYEQIIDDERVL
ncbi:MAG: hypothetical protein LBN07_02060 [Christensenellaceae bacterium]|jgi:hypothetical protein|nr:hypothetical protein [Christensenellaceae bacterium]